MLPTQNLTLKAAALARAAPELWHDFVTAIAELNELQRENLVTSQLDAMPVNQGRAQMMGTIHNYLANCKANADKIKKD